MHHIVYGDTIINTIGGDCNRYTESDYFLDIMLEKHKEGRNYIARSFIAISVSTL